MGISWNYWTVSTTWARKFTFKAKYQQNPFKNIFYCRRFFNNPVFEAPYLLKMGPIFVSSLYSFGNLYEKKLNSIPLNGQGCS